MQEYYKKYMAIHHKCWDELVNSGNMKEAGFEMDSYTHYSDLLKIAIRNNLH